jgi:hypothetical protein
MIDLMPLCVAFMLAWSVVLVVVLVVMSRKDKK